MRVVSPRAKFVRPVRSAPITTTTRLGQLRRVRHRGSLFDMSPSFAQVITLAVHWPDVPARQPRATVAQVRRCPSRFDFPGSLFLVLGKYQDTTGQSSCKACPAGAYCQGNNSDHAQLCSPGKYSPNPGLGANDCYMCPKGTYNNM